MNNRFKSYSITSVCKEDLTEFFTEKEIEKLDDVDMKHIARKMGDDYCEQLYWSSLKIIVENALKDKLNK